MKSFDEKIKNFLEKIHLYPTVRIYILTAACFIISAFLLIPGNPVFDWSKTKVPNAIFIYINLFLLTAALYLDRFDILRKFGAMKKLNRNMIFFGIILLLTLGIGLLYIFFPAYLGANMREIGGLIEPFTFLLFFSSFFFMLKYAGTLEQKGVNARPYKFLAFLFLIFTLEECNYFAFFALFIPRINDVYVGTIHDLFHLWLESTHKIIGILIFIFFLSLILYFLFSRKYLTGEFLKKELFAPSSLLIYLGIFFAIIGGIYDVAGEHLPKFNPETGNFPEEVLELYCSLFILIAVIQKFSRDYQRQRINLH